jgi:hypothetical protein
MNDATLYHTRAQAMLDFADGKVTETLARYDELLDADPALSPVQEANCRLDRSTVYSFANCWAQALSDLDACEALAPRLPRFLQKPTLSEIYHSKVKLLSNPYADGYDLAAAKDAISKLRAISPIKWLAEELESDLAVKAREWERALSFSSTALSMFEAEGWRKPAALMRRRMGEARLHMNQFELAEQDLAAARSYFNEFGSPDERAYADLAFAQLECARQQYDRAWELALQALSFIESLIRNFRVVTEQQQFLIDKLRFYDTAFEIGLAAGGHKGRLRAWTICERTKSFYLCHLMANADIRLFDGIDSHLIERLAELESELDCRTRAVMLCDTSERDQAERERNRISEERQKLLFQMMRDNRRWAAVKTPPEANMSDCFSALAPLWTPISYFWRDRESGADLFIFFTGPDREPRHSVVSWSSQELSALQDCHSLLGRGCGPTDPGPALQQLRSKLFPDELVGSLGTNNCLLISPHSRLRGFPIHALDLAYEDYVVKRWPIQYVPTLLMLAFPRRPTRMQKALFLGCPETRFNPVRLREVEAEITTLRDIWTEQRPGTVDSAIVSPDGSPAQAGFAISEWRKYRILHFCCHGDFPPGRPFDAALLLGADAVRASELFTVSLEASLVALSACDLGRQARVIERTSSDEWVGIYLPMFYAGAGELLVSLWEADSETAQRVMECLHLELSKGKSPARALQQALSSISDSALVQLWANWYLVGVPENVDTTHN